MNRDGRNLKRIKSATLCTFTVHWDAHNDTRRLPHRYPMSILLKCTGMNASSAKENLMIAVNMLVDIILKFPASDKHWGVKVSRQNKRRANCIYLVK